MISIYVGLGLGVLWYLIRMGAGNTLINKFKNQIMKDLSNEKSVSYNEDQGNSFMGDAYVVALWELQELRLIDFNPQTVGHSTIREYSLTLKGWAMAEKEALNGVD